MNAMFVVLQGSDAQLVDDVRIMMRVVRISMI